MEAPRSKRGSREAGRPIVGNSLRLQAEGTEPKTKKTHEPTVKAWSLHDPISKWGHDPKEWLVMDPFLKGQKETPGVYTL